MMSLLEFIETEPFCNDTKKKLPANASVIWLHGLGASGHDFEMMPKQLNLPKDSYIRFIFPHAPQIPVTINAGYVMPAWYDILEMTEIRKINEQQLLDSVNEVHKFIQRELDRGISSERIIIAGFSQGGAVAYHAALTFPLKLGGLMGLSTYFVTSDNIAPNPVNQAIPIQIYHGSRDPMVVEAQGKRAYDDLISMGYQVGYKSYPMEHELCFEEVADISTFIQQHLP
jgi:phospholipase/carboxylesterase